MGLLLCWTGWLIPALPARLQAAGDVSANTGGPSSRAEWSGPAKDTPQSIPAGLIRVFGYKAEKKSSLVLRQRASEALTGEPAETASRV
jgi:hypothetical protein